MTNTHARADQRLNSIEANAFAGSSSGGDDDKQMERLIVSDNAMTRIAPEMFNGLTNLRELDIGGERVLPLETS